MKVLDFGLAKAMEPVGAAANMSHSPMITTPAMTGVGVILGTAAYVSPEQARGKPIDKRTDVWAFDCLLFEMLTGKRGLRGRADLRRARISPEDGAKLAGRAKRGAPVAARPSGRGGMPTDFVD